MRVGESGGEGDALDELVQLQKDRQRRLAAVANAPGWCGRLALRHLPPPPPLLDPLDEFARFAAANPPAPRGGTKAAFGHDYWGQPGRYQGRGVAPSKYAGMPTKMGLHYAVAS